MEKMNLEAIDEEFKHKFEDFMDNYMSIEQ